jgi:peptidylprolyl isomerase/peptidyl-prolyl cis-trans isomerase C
MADQKIHCHHILVTHQYEAEDILRKLKAGESFDEMARIFSQCPSSKLGGDLGAFGRGRTDPDFEDAAFALDIDAISKPIRSKFGYHIIKRIS